MIAAGSWRSRVMPWLSPVALAALILLLLAGGQPVRAVLAYERAALEHGQIWRLVTGHLVHLGWYHAVLNLIALLALCLLCPQPLSPREWIRRLTVLSVSISLMLYAFVPTVVWYVGLSGVLHGLFLLGLVPMARRGDRVAIACLLYLLAKLTWEQVMGTPVSDATAIGGRVVTEAHLFGTLAGLAYGLAFGSIRRGDESQ